MAKSTILTALNLTGSILQAGSVVYISGFDDDSKLSTVALADNRNESRMPAIGIVREDIENGDQGVIKVGGPVVGFNTNNTNINDDVFVGTNGNITFSDPIDANSDALSQQLGTVLSVSSAPNGQVHLFPLEVRRRIKHTELIEVRPDQHHVKLHATQHAAGAIDELKHGTLSRLRADDHPQYLLVKGTRSMSGNLNMGANNIVNVGVIGTDIGAHVRDLNDDHLQYIRVDGTRSFTGTVSGITPTLDSHLATKAYVDSVGGSGTTDHGLLTGLGDDDHTQYALLAGRAGGQSLIGGTASGEDLTLESTANATKGSIFFGTSEYDEVNNRLGVNKTSPSVEVDISGQLALITGTYPPLDVRRSTSSTNSRQASFRLAAESSQTFISDGFGTQIDLGFGDNSNSTILGRWGIERNGADNSSQMFFQTANAGSLDDRMVIDPTGQVGIGTTSPSEQLTIEEAGDGITHPILKLNFTEDTSHDAEDILGEIQFGNDDGETSTGAQPITSYIRCVHTRSGTGHSFEDGGLTFGTLDSNVGSVTERMRINQDGLVAIAGSTSTNGQLSVYAPSAADPMLWCRDGSNAADFTVYAPSNGLISLQAGGGDDLRLVAGGGATDRIRIYSNGDMDFNFNDPQNGNTNILVTADEPTYPDEGLSVRCLSNPANGEPIFRVISSGGSERLRVEHAGDLRTTNRLGVNRGAATYQLEVQGDAGKTASGTGWNIISDIAKKKNIIDLVNPDLLLMLRPRVFEWNVPEEHGNETGQVIGFIAQEVEEVFPDWVTTDKNGEKWVQMKGVEALIIKKLQDIETRLSALESNMPT